MGRLEIFSSLKPHSWRDREVAKTAYRSDIQDPIPRVEAKYVSPRCTFTTLSLSRPAPRSPQADCYVIFCRPVIAAKFSPSPACLSGSAVELGRLFSKKGTGRLVGKIGVIDFPVTEAVGGGNACRAPDGPVTAHRFWCRPGRIRFVG